MIRDFQAEIDSPELSQQHGRHARSWLVRCYRILFYATNEPSIDDSCKLELFHLDPHYPAERRTVEWLIRTAPSGRGLKTTTVTVSHSLRLPCVLSYFVCASALHSLSLSCMCLCLSRLSHTFYLSLALWLCLTLCLRLCLMWYL